MGGCLTTTDSLSNNDEITNPNDSNKKDSNIPDIYCNDWLKFPICCPYCTNHSEPSAEFQLVILGPGYTGKTTLRHHLVQRYGHAFCKADFLMYRDILQHNVLDLFRDLLQKPSLTFTELRQFIACIHKQPATATGTVTVTHKKQQQPPINSACDNYYESEPEIEEAELDSGLHDLYASDTEEFKKNRYLCRPNIDKQPIHSNSSSLISVSSSPSLPSPEPYNSGKDAKYNHMIRKCNDTHVQSENNDKSAQITDKSPATSIINELNNMYDSDGSTYIHDFKYSSINQSSPITPKPNVTMDGNFDAFASQNACDNKPNHPTLDQCVLFDSIDTISQSERDTVDTAMSATANNAKHKWIQKMQRQKSTFSALLHSFKSCHEKESGDICTADVQSSNTGINYRKTELCTRDTKATLFSEYGIRCIADLLHRLSTEKLKYGRDNGQYLVLNSARILHDAFEPNFIDLLQCHVRSTGLMFENHVICRKLPINKYNNTLKFQNKQDIVFRVVDVGGHRNERKKWSYVLQQDNDVIVFVVSAASFCQVLFEDFKKNAMRESIAVWEDIISNNENQSSATQFILVINKIDLFYQRCDLFAEYFPEYQGRMDRYAILEYIKSLYLNIARKYNKFESVHCVCTKLTDSLEIASFDVEQMRDILMNYQFEAFSFICKDIVDTIIDYAVGDVFWSEKWLQPMWERKMLKNKMNNNLHSHLCLNNKMNEIGIDEQVCDHVNNPHDYHRHRKRKRKKRNSKLQFMMNKLNISVKSVKK